MDKQFLCVAQRDSIRLDANHAVNTIHFLRYGIFHQVIQQYPISWVKAYQKTIIGTIFPRSNSSSNHTNPLGKTLKCIIFSANPYSRNQLLLLVVAR